MMVTTPIPVIPVPAAAPAATPAPPPPATAGAPTAPAVPSPPKADDAPAPPTDAAAAKQAVLDKLDATSAADAMTQVTDQLAKVATLSVGGGTPEGIQSAKAASAMLTDASMLLQHAHVKAMEQLRTMATELHMRLMSSASGLAFMGGQVALAGQSKAPVKLADIIAAPVQETTKTMADVTAALAPKPAPAAPAAPPAPAAPAPVPGGLQHVTPGPGAGRGPNPA